jgi:hypothetical protein
MWSVVAMLCVHTQAPGLNDASQYAAQYLTPRSCSNKSAFGFGCHHERPGQLSHGAMRTYISYAGL